MISPTIFSTDDATTLVTLVEEASAPISLDTGRSHEVGGVLVPETTRGVVTAITLE